MLSAHRELVIRNGPRGRAGGAGARIHGLRRAARACIGHREAVPFLHAAEGEGASGQGDPTICEALTAEDFADPSDHSARPRMHVQEAGLPGQLWIGCGVLRCAGFMNTVRF